MSCTGHTGVQILELRERLYQTSIILHLTPSPVPGQGWGVKDCKKVQQVSLALVM